MFSPNANLEMSIFLQQVKTYETITGLTKAHMTYDSTSLWLDWNYPDGTWAGTTSYDLPLECASEKLESEIDAERNCLCEGLPMFASRYQTSVLAERVG